MKYKVKPSNKFKKGLKRAEKRGLNMDILMDVIITLGHGIPLEDKYRDHALKGKFKGFRECHIQPNWLLLYLVEEDILTLTLIDTGTHSDIFGM